MSASQYVTCPRCGHSAHLRIDGTLGTHWANRGKHARRRCPTSGQQHHTAPTGRRVTVTVDLVLPLTEWDAHRARAAIVAAIRDHCPELSAVTVDVEASS